MQHQRTQHMLGFPAIRPGQMVLLPGFHGVLPANAFQQLPPWHQVISVPGSHHWLYQDSTIVLPAQHIPQNMLQGQIQFLIPGQLVPSIPAYESGSVVPGGAGGWMSQEAGKREEPINVLPPAPSSSVPASVPKRSRRGSSTRHCGKEMGEKCSKYIRMLPPAPTAEQALDQSKTSPKEAPTLEPGKKADFQKQLQKHQEAVLNPDYKTPFSSFNDALQRLLPYHLYEDTSDEDYRQVDEKFEEVSAQLLQRKQALLDKYCHLFLKESQKVSPDAEMVMIERMFIEEEKTMLALDKQSAKENPDKYISSLSCSQSLSSSVAPVSVSSVVPAPKSQKVPPICTNKVGIKRSRSSSSIILTKAPPSLNEDNFPSRSKIPTNTLEGSGQIPLKMKIRKEDGIYRVVQNTILDPVHQPLPLAKRRKTETF